MALHFLHREKRLHLCFHNWSSDLICNLYHKSRIVFQKLPTFRLFPYSVSMHESETWKEDFLFFLIQEVHYLFSLFLSIYFHHVPLHNIHPDLLFLLYFQHHNMKFLYHTKINPVHLPDQLWLLLIPVYHPFLWDDNCLWQICIHLLQQLLCHQPKYLSEYLQNYPYLDLIPLSLWQL